MLQRCGNKSQKNSLTSLGEFSRIESLQIEIRTRLAWETSLSNLETYLLENFKEGRYPRKKYDQNNNIR